MSRCVQKTSYLYITGPEVVRVQLQLQLQLRLVYRYAIQLLHSSMSCHSSRLALPLLCDWTQLHSTPLLSRLLCALRSLSLISLHFTSLLLTSLDWPHSLKCDTRPTSTPLCLHVLYMPLSSFSFASVAARTVRVALRCVFGNSFSK